MTKHIDRILDGFTAAGLLLSIVFAAEQQTNQLDYTAFYLAALISAAAHTFLAVKTTTETKSTQ